MTEERNEVEGGAEGEVAENRKGVGEGGAVGDAAGEGKGEADLE